MGNGHAHHARGLFRHFESADQFCRALHDAGIPFDVVEAVEPAEFRGAPYRRHDWTVRVEGEDVATFTVYRAA